MIYETDTASYRWWDGTLWQSMIPIGTVQAFSSNTLPTGWLLCESDTTYNAVSSPQYADLYSVIGNTYGGTNNTNFKLPELRGRAVFGRNTSNGNVNNLNSQDAISIASRAPQHTHDLSNHTHTINSHTHGSGSLYATQTVGGNIQYWIERGGVGWFGNEYGGQGNAGIGANFGEATNVYGSTDGSGTLTSNGPNVNNSGTSTVPYMTLNYIIKF
jgi:microcystin-dependent protein